jgi:hypothetical protein
MNGLLVGARRARRPGRAEYSQAEGQHWRVTIAAALIRGEPDDFLGQYRRNSHFSFVLRYSF